LILGPFSHGKEKKPPFDEVFKKLDNEVRVALKKIELKALRN